MLNKQKKGSITGLKIILAVICGLIVGTVLATLNYSFGATVSSVLFGVLIKQIAYERTSDTGLGNIIGFIAGFFSFVLYRLLIRFVLQLSIPLVLIVFYLPFFIFALVIIEKEFQKNKKETTVTGHRTVTAFPNNSEFDPYFVDIGWYVIEKNKVSVAMIQRVYQIGYERASQIIDQLCSAGVIGKANGTASWEILMTKNEFENYLKISGCL